jgi:hypothetical protein
VKVLPHFKKRDGAPAQDRVTHTPLMGMYENKAAAIVVAIVTVRKVIDIRQERDLQKKS